MGLIAGAMAGAGEAGVKSGLEYQKQAGEMDLQKVRDQAHLDREATLQHMRDQSARSMEQDVRQPFQRDMQAEGFKHSENLQKGGFAHAENLQAGQFSHAEDLQRAQQNFQRSENEMTRNMTREQIASNEKIAASNRGISLEIAKLGGTVQQDKDGAVLYIGKDGVAKSVTDPNTGKPMTGFKDLTPAAKQYAEVLKAQLVGLDKEEVAAMGDKTVIDKVTERRADLNNKLLNVLTGGIDKSLAKPAASGDRPPLASFGPQGAGAAAAPSTPASGSYDLQEPPGTLNSDVGVRGKGLIGRGHARRDAEEQAKREREDQLRTQGEGYGSGY